MAMGLRDAGIRRRLGRLPRPTVAGWVVILGTAFVGFLAIRGGEIVPTALFGLLLAMLGVSMVVPALNLRGVIVTRELPEKVFAGERFGVAARIGLKGRITESFGIVLEDGVDGPYTRPGYALALRVAPGESTRVRYHAQIRNRGRHAVTSCRVSTRFPFGLFEHSVRLDVRSEMLVFPRLGEFDEDPLPGSRFARRMTSTETVHEKGHEEFRNLREYRSGDSPRLISWKATARHGDLMVRELEDDLTKRVTIFLESRLPEGARRHQELRLERAISFTATLLHELARRRYFVRLYSLAPDPAMVEGGRGGRRLDRIMEHLAVLTPTTSGTIEDLVASCRSEVLWTSMPVFVLPVFDRRTVTAALGRMPPRVEPVIFRADGVWERSVFLG